LFAKDNWWVFADFFPGMDRPVWLRTEDWISNHLGRRSMALEGACGYLYARLSKSEEALFIHQYPTRAQEELLKRALLWEQKVMNRVYAELIGNPTFSVRTDAPEGMK
jgi:hypothetical protein